MKIKIDICDINLTPEKEKELMTTYKVSDKDIIDFDKFYELSVLLSREGEDKKAELEDLEYSKV